MAKRDYISLTDIAPIVIKLGAKSKNKGRVSKKRLVKYLGKRFRRYRDSEIEKILERAVVFGVITIERGWVSVVGKPVEHCS